ncbi:hypothetical protein MUG87_02900 [Ectobacillus sp. JY-23]|uniref:hypothetical protein n=1 Tax=Ectobacillus sp. JY-23 TaxID=2933872 RepID=UPI001FF4D649|nr:hypothetical protein [Ectobacillus sp. JY-23]UOY93100.1 hypothetical protein MUG87_02900 [Ectobacillus sp. JY-23]
MTIIGYVFWGLCAVLIGGSFWMQRKYRSSEPYKSDHQEFYEESAKLDYNSPRNDSSFL